METLNVLSDGNSGVRAIGAVEYFEMFFDWFPTTDTGDTLDYSVFTAEERTVLNATLRIMNQACDATTELVSDDELIASGWPTRVQPIAKAALDVMHRRGPSDEEEDEHAG